jgi:hypothetical protein
MVQCASDANAMFMALPNGPILAGNDFNGAKAWLKQKGRATA